MKKCLSPDFMVKGMCSLVGQSCSAGAVGVRTQAVLPWAKPQRHVPGEQPRAWEQLEVVEGSGWDLPL